MQLVGAPRSSLSSLSSLRQREHAAARADRHLIHKGSLQALQGAPKRSERAPQMAQPLRAALHAGHIETDHGAVGPDACTELEPDPRAKGRWEGSGRRDGVCALRTGMMPVSVPGWTVPVTQRSLQRTFVSRGLSTERIRHFITADKTNISIYSQSAKWSAAA